RRDRPGCCSPDRNRSPAGKRAGSNRKAYVDGRIGSLPILNLSLCESRLSSRAPENGLPALINQILLYDVHEETQDCRLVGRIKRQIGMIPIPKDPKAAELLLLNVDVLSRITL